MSPREMILMQKITKPTYSHFCYYMYFSSAKKYRGIHFWHRDTLWYRQYLSPSDSPTF